MSQRKGLDIRSAAWKLADDLKAWQELGGFETAIQNAKHQLDLLQIAFEDRKATIAAMVDFRKAGQTDDEIANLELLRTAEIMVTVSNSIHQLTVMRKR
jgi:hypothetical protein